VYAIARNWIDDRPHIDRVASISWTDAHLFDGAFQGFDQWIAGFSDRDGNAAGHAALPAATESGADNLTGRCLQISIGHDEQVVLCAPCSLHPFSMRGCSLIDVPRDIGRADETDRRNFRVGEQGIDCFGASMNDIENAFR